MEMKFSDGNYFLRVNAPEFIAINRIDGLLAILAKTYPIRSDWRWIVSASERFLFLKRIHLELIREAPAFTDFDLNFKRVIILALEKERDSDALVGSLG